MQTSPPDAYGRVTVDAEAAFKALYDGVSLAAVVLADSVEVEAFNARCARLDMERFALRRHEAMTHTPDDEHRLRAAGWFVGNEIADLDLRAFFVSLCTSPEAEARVHEELDLFADRGLDPLLRAMICLVADWRARGIVWGVGRGSSVASYVLFLIGVHRVDPMKYGLSVREFLKG